MDQCKKVLNLKINIKWDVKFEDRGNEPLII